MKIDQAGIIEASCGLIDCWIEFYASPSLPSPFFSTCTENLPSPGTPTFFFFHELREFLPSPLSPFVIHLSYTRAQRETSALRCCYSSTRRRERGRGGEGKNWGKNIHTLFNRGTPRCLARNFPLPVFSNPRWNVGSRDGLRNFIPGNFRVLGEELAFKARAALRNSPEPWFFAHSSLPRLKAFPPPRVVHTLQRPALLFFFRFA